MVGWPSGRRRTSSRSCPLLRHGRRALSARRLLSNLCSLSRFAGAPGRSISLRVRRLASLFGGRVGALGDARRFAPAIPQIVKLCAANLAPAQDLDRVDHRRIDGENALDALAVGNLTDGEALVEAP